MGAALPLSREDHGRSTPPSIETEHRIASRRGPHPTNPPTSQWHAPPWHCRNGGDYDDPRHKLQLRRNRSCFGLGRVLINRQTNARRPTSVIGVKRTGADLSVCPLMTHSGLAYRPAASLRRATKRAVRTSTMSMAATFPDLASGLGWSGFPFISQAHDIDTRSNVVMPLKDFL